jgi:dolichol-phosphate mannosyltransferase
MRLSVILPTYNERDTLPPLVARLRRVGAELPLEVIVVDDGSPDGTAAVALALARDDRFPLRVLRRPQKAGLASAVLAGAALASAPVVAVMDSDGSHPPEVLPGLVAAVEGGAGIAVASRYASGGRIEEWPAWRRLASLAATAAARLLLHPRVRDPLSGFFALRREVLVGPSYRAVGFKILLEILARHRHLPVVEIGYTFRDRAAGRSKLTWREIVAFGRLLGRLTVGRVRRPTRGRVD